MGKLELILVNNERLLCPDGKTIVIRSEIKNEMLETVVRGIHYMRCKQNING
jgi:hypothetical protein